MVVGTSSISSVVAATEEEREDRAMDWTLEDLEGDPAGRRCVAVTLTKVRPAPSMPMWWDRVFSGDVKGVDVGSISGRWAGSEGEARREGWNSAWAEAHRKFKQQPTRPGAQVKNAPFLKYYFIA